MLQLFDFNHNKIHGLTKYKELKRESTLDGDEILSFLYPQKDEKYKDIKEECYIRTRDNEYVIKEANIKDDWTEFICKVNVEALKGKAIDRFETIGETCIDAVNLALAGTGWSIGDCDVTKRRTVRKNNVHSYEVLQEVRRVYRCDLKFDAINKKVYIYQSMGEDKGVYFKDKLNLKGLEVQSNSYDYCTRLIPIGKDGLRISEINDGKDYVENYQYTNKIITAYWEDNRYTVVENLKEDAIERLNEISKPRRAYKADIIDLAKANEKYKDVLDYSLGDTITLLSKDKRVKEKQRIVKLIEYPDEPEKNTCEIANRVSSLEDMQVDFIETTDTVDNITTTDGMVDSSKVDFEPIRLEVESMVSEKADITDLNTAVARIGNLEVTKAEITELDTERARIDDLYATRATIEQLDVTNARVTTLEGKTANIEYILAGNITAEHIATGAITAGSGIIADGAIGDAQISNLSADKLDAGKINTALVDIIGPDGRLKLTGNRLQIFDGDGVNLYERIFLGVDDENNANLTLRGADGQTVLLTQDGLTDAGFTDGYNKLEDNSLDPKKIDIQKVVTRINEGTMTIEASKILLDNKTLDVQFNTIRTTVSDHGQMISSQSSQITALDTAIGLKVDTQTYNSKMTSIDGAINLINTDLSKATSDISVLQEQIVLKVEQSDIDTAVNTLSEEVNTNINTKVSEINTNIDGITSRVSATESNITTLNNDVSTLENRVSTAESTISIHSDEIAQRVSKDGVISAINLSPETIRIAANRLIIGNDTTFEEGVLFTWQDYYGMTWREIIDTQ